MGEGKFVSCNILNGNHDEDIPGIYVGNLGASILG